MGWYTLFCTLINDDSRLQSLDGALAMKCVAIELEWE